MFERELDVRLKTAASYYPVITLTGPRQSGKTTLVRHVFREHEYLSLEEPDIRHLAMDDPRGFLAQFNGPVILDEVQKASELFSYLQGIADSDGRPGRFVLTGSQNFLLLQGISQSLAGRCAVMHLLPLSMDELFALHPIDDDIIKADTAARPGPGLSECIFSGFYPAIHDKTIPPQDWLKNYYQTYLERDVREIANVGDIELFRRFVGLCAGRSGQLLNLSSLASDCGITHTTARRWLSILETSFIVMLLRPYHGNFNKRLIKSPKLYFLDTGLLCYLLRLRSPEDFLIHAMKGAIFETFVIAEIYKRFMHMDRVPDMYFFRDASGHEIDLVIEQDRPIVIEIKAGETINTDFFKGIEYWMALTGANKDVSSSYLIYGGNRSLVQKGIHVRSWWNF